MFNKKGTNYVRKYISDIPHMYDGVRYLNEFVTMEGNVYEYIDYLNRTIHNIETKCHVSPNSGNHKVNMFEWLATRETIETTKILLDTIDTYGEIDTGLYCHKDVHRFLLLNIEACNKDIVDRLITIIDEHRSKKSLILRLF